MRNLMLAAALLCAALPAAAQIGSPGDGSSYVGPLGPAPDGIPQLAQTFVRPAAGDNWLQDFTFYLGDFNADASGSNLLFRAAVYAVNGTTLGAQLYASDVRSGSANYSGFDSYTFAPGLYLDPSISVFALVLQTISSQSDALNAVASGTTDYAGGALYTVNTDGTLSAVEGTSDAAFQATLRATTTPEPATVVLLASGLLAVGLACRRIRS